MNNANGPHCGLKSCDINGQLDERIEVKTVLPQGGIKDKTTQIFKISWRVTGEAEFHNACWDKVYSMSRSRVRPGPGKVTMVTEEKALVKTAAEALEMFDAQDKVLHEAQRAAQWIKSANHGVVFTGAGISTSAGIGDYRGKAGKWTEEDQNHTVDMDTVFAGTLSTSDEPDNKKQKLEPAVDNDDDGGVPYEKLRPTYTHEALHKLMESGYIKYIISQNGDGLHGLSGVPQDKLSELHGNVFLEMCEKCGDRYDRKFYVMDDIGSQYYEEIEDFGKATVKKPKFAKKCDLCGLSHRTGKLCEKKKCKGNLKDTIINFRDMLEEDILDRARDNARDCDVMLCLGTTLQVTPAADLVKKMKNRNKLIICNRQETPVDGQFSKKGPDGEGKGSRVFGDCDVFMKEIMSHIYPQEELKQWEAERTDRLAMYDKQRD